MGGIRTRIVILSFLLVVVPSLSRATDVLFDHVEFIREEGKPQSVTAAFTACDPEGDFTIVVENGQDGEHRVSSGSISLNGLEVVSQEDFNQQVAVISKDLFNVQEANQLNVLLTSAPGSVINVTVTGEMICLEITIDSPTSGSTLYQDEITVSGTVRHRTPEVGVEVNGILAQVNGDFWVANDVPLEPGENLLLATVTDEKDKTATVLSTVILAAPDAPSIALVANVEGGITPLAVDFSLDNNTGVDLVLYKIDFEGDGSIDLESVEFIDIAHTYQAEGVFWPTVAGMDASGQEYTDSLAVNVHPIPPLKNKWERMKSSLVEMDVTSAVKTFTPQSAELYQEVFNALGPRLPQITATMQDLQLIYLIGDVAKYRIQREELVEGVPTQVTYYVYFVRDAKGFWKIKSF